jgi:hypothetical protein
MTSTINFLVPRSLDNSDELTTVLESLPSYENLKQTSDEPPVFDDEKEPATGIINLIRHNSQPDDPTIDTITTVGYS